MGFWGNLFGRETPEEKAARAAGALAEHAARTNTLFERALGHDPAHASNEARQKAAISLVLANETAKGREAWLAISRDHPDELAHALEQVGVCYHLEKDYRAALESYEAAIRLGADSGQLADNIAEARKGMAALG